MNRVGCGLFIAVFATGCLGGGGGGSDIARDVGGDGVVQCAVPNAVRDGGIRPSLTPHPEVMPDALVFPALPAGESVERVVTLRNLGEGCLKVAEVRLVTHPAFEWTLVEGDGTRHAQELVAPPIEFGAGGQVEITVRYTSTGGDDSGGELLVETNSASSLRVPVVVSNVGPQTNVSPRVLDFGRVSAETPRTEHVTVANVGQVPLHIEAVTLNGSDAFRARIGQQAVADALADPDGDGEGGVAPGQQFTLDITTDPGIVGPAVAELVISSDDPLTPQVTVSLSANTADACIRVEPESMQLSARAGEENIGPLTLSSCGGHQLEITRIYLVDDADAAFWLDQDSVPLLPDLLPAAGPGDDALPSRAIDIGFGPAETGEYHGMLVVESNDPFSPRIEVPLVGTAP